MKRILFYIFLLLTYYGFSQENDMATWVSAGISKEIADDFDISLEQGIRLSDNSSAINSINTDLGLSYSLAKHFDLKLGYRFSNKSKDNGYFAKHRWNIDGSFDTKISRFKFEYRNRFQIEKDTYINEQTDLYPTYENRNKLKIEYNIRGCVTDPYTSVETYHILNAATPYSITNYRYSLGVTTKLKYDIKLDIAFLYNRSLSETIENAFIFNLGVSYKLD